MRCRNNALAGPFGGCFAVQQIDTDEKTNVANSIPTIQKLDAVLAQIQQNQADFEVSVNANANAGTEEAAQNLAAVNAILQNTIVTKSFAAETPTVVNGGGAGNTLETSVVSDPAATPGSETTAAAGAETTAAAGSGDVVTTAITPATPAQTDNANTGNGNGNGNGNGRGRNGRNRNNGNANNAQTDAADDNGNGFGSRFRNGNVGRAVSGMRWAKRS